MKEKIKLNELKITSQWLKIQPVLSIDIIVKIEWFTFSHADYRSYLRKDAN
ncbi:hypothetical protein [Spiroplasma endosymbiont of Polydrusus formosus]|uniref:hypothetical protein n=1 Tax=Spiroplasma endosymbiont of Polydrusus formosus TaxID=3139326 RepID=UPI0035B54ADC